MIPRKVLYFDVETTGKKPDYHDIIQLAYILEVNGKVVESEFFYIQPLHPERAEPEALAVNGIDPEEFPTFLHPQLCKCAWEDRWSKHVDKYNPADKMWPCAFNGTFDLGFLAEFYKRQNDQYLGSWLNWNLLDPLPLIRAMRFKGRFPELPNNKLATIAEHFDIPLKAHDAVSDVAALREIMHRLGDMFDARTARGLSNPWTPLSEAKNTELNSYLDNFDISKLKGVSL